MVKRVYGAPLYRDSEDFRTVSVGVPYFRPRHMLLVLLQFAHDELAVVVSPQNHSITGVE
jgi:hypothetical protein